jgi:manganese/zinc/iron transport system substrate-binding protein
MILTTQKMFFDFPKTMSAGLAARAAGLLVPLAALAAGCGPASSAVSPAGARSLPAGDESRGPRVVATTTVVADLVRQVGGDRVAVECLMAPGIDPHSYKPTPRDADRLAGADLVVASGLHLEGKLAGILERLGERRPVAIAAASLPDEELIAVGGGMHDPHVWFDPKLWSRCAPVVAEALSRIDPAAAEGYRQRAAAYARRLRDLDERLRARIAAIPPDRRVLVTAHDAFRYFGRAYGLEVVGVQGTSTESEAGLADINRLVDLVVARGLPAVFIETSVSNRNVAALCEGARARGHDVVLGGTLHSDSLGGPGSGAETLEAALTRNVETIVAGLTGMTAPDAPKGEP